MILLQSSLENVEDRYSSLNDELNKFAFTLGGNWDYEHGCFDRSLDEVDKIWLRIPFQVTGGTLDGETISSDAIIKLGKPFVLKHLYNEGLDGEAKVKTYGGLFDQFQKPVDKDAAVEQKWVDAAADLLKKIESGFEVSSVK